MFLLFASFSFILGIFLGKYFIFKGLVLLGIGLFLFLISFFSKKNPKIFFFSWILIAFLFGLWRYQTSVAVIDRNHIAYFRDRGKKIVLTGWVDQKPVERDQKKQLIINAEEVFLNNETNQAIKVRGHIQVNVPNYVKIFYGDSVRVEGELISPPVFDSFNYKDYLEQRDIFAFVKNAEVTDLKIFKGNKFLYWLYKFNLKFEKTINSILPEPESSLLSGLLLGIKRGFSDSLNEAFFRTGTTHIVVLSGFNISIIVGALQMLIGNYLQRKKKLYILISGIALFIIFVGLTPSVVRAGIMAGFILLAQTIGRKRELTTSFVFTAGLMLLFNPLTLYDIGFQLSFLSTAGILYIFPKLKTSYWFAKISQKLPQTIWDTAILTLSAQIAVLPLLVYYFGSFSVVSLVVNILILEIIPIAMLLGFLNAFLGLAFISLAKYLAIFAFYPLHYILLVIKFFAEMPFASIEIKQVSFFWVVLYYVLILIWLKPEILGRKKTFSNSSLSQNVA